MKKPIIILSLFLSSVFIVSGQQWDSLQSGVINSYSTGYHYGIVFAQTIYNGNLYIGGQFNGAGSIAANNIAEWNGTKWLSVDIGTTSLKSGQPDFVQTLCVYDTELYAGGVFDSMGAKPIASIARWNGVRWSAVGTGMKLNTNWGIYSMCVYNGDLYVGGTFDSIGGIAANNIAKWNGAVWSAVGTGVSYNPYLNWVDVLCEYKGQLYIGGRFDTAGGIPVSNIAKWDGSTWSPVSKGISGSVAAMAVYNDSLYIGGQFDTAGGKLIANIATWNGINWSPVGNGINDWVFALCVYDSALCVGGQFDIAGNITANNIAYWNGRAWGTFGSGIVARATSCLSLYSFNSVLYAGGFFPSAGGIPCNSIAQWTGGVLGINNVAEGNRAMSVYPNPSKGAFTLVIASEAKQSPSILEVYNVLGEKVYSSPLFTVNYPLVIDLTNQPSGVYLCRIVSGKILTEGKLVLQK